MVGPAGRESTRLLTLGACAQSVALEHYEREADSMVERFRTINAKVATSGSLTIRSNNLFKVVALQNQIMTEIIQRLNLLDR